MSEEPKKEGATTVERGLVRVERESDPSGYHLAKVAGGCPDAEQTFCGLPLVDALRGMRMVAIKEARRSIPRPMQRKRGLCCRGCWTGCPDRFKEGFKEKIVRYRKEEGRCKS